MTPDLNPIPLKPCLAETGSQWSRTLKKEHGWNKWRRSSGIKSYCMYVCMIYSHDTNSSSFKEIVKTIIAYDKQSQVLPEMQSTRRVDSRKFLYIGFSWEVWVGFKPNLVSVLITIQFNCFVILRLNLRLLYNVVLQCRSRILTFIVCIAESCLSFIALFVGLFS